MKASWKIQVSQWVYPVTAVLLLAVPLRWLLAAGISACFHELCHLAVIRLLGYSVEGVEIGTGGTVIRTPAMTPGRELLCTVAGPIGGVILFLMIRWLPCVALCAGVQTLFNLLPVFPMDGGRILRCLRQLRGK